MRYRLLIVGLIYFLFLSCNTFGPEEKPQTIQIQGNVTRSNGTPIEGQSVALWRHEGLQNSRMLGTHTDENGYYYLKYIFSIYECNEIEIYLWVEGRSGSNAFSEDIRCVESIQTIDFVI